VRLLLATILHFLGSVRIINILKQTFPGTLGNRKSIPVNSNVHDLFLVVATHLMQSIATCGDAIST